MTDKQVFNSSLESGVRVVSFLDAYYPDSLDFEQLMKIDYIVVNSADFDGPDSLHPQIPNRQGELSTRREIVRSGIELMKKFGLIEIDLNPHGVFYRATESAEPYLGLMKEKYSLELKIVAQWLANEIREDGFSRLDLGLKSRVF
ncbi:ABC-three component system middle component 2 [Vibrio sp.]|uniref:ABC-three component system middle component 2 n=1 Tax=Vibrio sp. TaxID=678 RepID=UPI003F6C2EF9